MADEVDTTIGETPETEGGAEGGEATSNYQDSPYFIATEHNRQLIDPSNPNYNSDEGIEYRQSLDRAREVDARNEVRREVHEREFADDARARWGGAPGLSPQDADDAASTPLSGYQTPEEARRLARTKSSFETWEEFRERQEVVGGMFRERDETRARLERRGELQFERESDREFEKRRAAFRETAAEATRQARETGQPVEYQGPQSQLSWELERLNAQGLGSAEFGEALDDLAGLVRFEGTAQGKGREWLAEQATFFGEVGEAVAEGRAGTPEALEKAIGMLGEVYHSADVTPEQRAYLDRVIEAHAEAKGRAMEWVTGLEADLLDQGLTSDELAHVRERQGGTITKFLQADADAVNALRGVRNAEALDQHFEAALLGQGATPDEIAYVRERQGGAITKFEQADADAVNAMRGVRNPVNAEALDQHFEAALLEQGATPEEIAYVRERQGGTITKFEQDDANAVNAMRGYLAAGAEFAARQGIEAALAAEGLTPDEIAHVRERQGGTITKFVQADADAVNAMRRIAVIAAAATAQETGWLEDQDGLAEQYRAIADYQVKADLWESEESMGAPEVNPEPLRAWTARTSLDSGEQTDQPGSLPAYDIPRELVAPTPEDARAIRRDARQISQGLFPEPPIESVSEAEAAEARLERILNRGLMPAPEPSPKDSALLDAIGTAHEQAGFHAQEYQRAFAEGRHEDAQESLETARNFAHVYKTLITKVDTYTPDTPDTVIDPNSPFNPALTGEDIADLTQGSLSLAGQVVLRSADPTQSSYTPTENRAFQAGVQVASIQSQMDWNDKEIDRLEQDVARLGRAVASGMTGPLGEERLAKSKELLAVTKNAQDVLKEANSQWQTVFNREGGTDEIQAHANTAVVKHPGLWFSALSMMAPNLTLMLKVAQAKSVAGEEGKDISSDEHRRLAAQAINSAVWTGLLPLSVAGYGLAAKGAGRGVSALVSPILGRGTVRTPGGLVVGKEILVHEVPEELVEAGFDYLSLGVVGGQGGWRDHFNPVSIAGQAALFGGAQGLARPVGGNRGFGDGVPPPPGVTPIEGVHFGAGIDYPAPGDYGIQLEQRLVANRDLLSAGEYYTGPVPQGSGYPDLPPGGVALGPTGEVVEGTGRHLPEDEMYGGFGTVYRYGGSGLYLPTAPPATAPVSIPPLPVSIPPTPPYSPVTPWRAAPLETTWRGGDAASPEPVPIKTFVPVEMPTRETSTGQPSTPQPDSTAALFAITPSNWPYEAPREWDAAAVTLNEGLGATPAFTPVAVQEPTPTLSQKPTLAVAQNPTPMVVLDPTPALAQKAPPVAALDPTPALAQKATPVDALETTPALAQKATPVDALETTPVAALDPITVPGLDPTPATALDPALAFAQGTNPTLDVDPTLALAQDPTRDPTQDPTQDPTVTVTPTRLRVGGKSLEEELEEGVQPGEYASVVQVVTPPALVTTVLGSGEERAKALGTLSDIEVVATEPEPVIEASHEGRTAVIETGSRGRVRVRPIEETHYTPESHLTHRPRIPKRAGLTPKPPKPPSTKTPKARGRSKGRAAFTAAMRK